MIKFWLDFWSRIKEAWIRNNSPGPNPAPEDSGKFIIPEGIADALFGPQKPGYIYRDSTSQAPRLEPAQPASTPDKAAEQSEKGEYSRDSSEPPSRLLQ